MQFDSYRPELHYMRGRGPKWHARHGLDADNEAGTKSNLSIKRADSTFRNWPNKASGVICAAGTLSVVLLLSIAASLIGPSSLLASAERPAKGCVAVSKEEYQGAYRKKLLLTRFGTYERTGRLGQRYYWYCR
jgi:hypothetical protein